MDNGFLQRRRLPHWRPAGKVLFLTWRLHESLPRGRVFSVANSSSGEEFAALDRLLDQGRWGPTYLAIPAVAEIVVEEIELAFGGSLAAWVVMPNHVHLVAGPVEDWSRALQLVKGRSSRRASLLLGVSGREFWQAESYDRWIRNGDEFGRVVRYVERNPVRAGLVERPELFRWSSAWGEE